METLKIELTQEELGLVREAIANLEEIDERCDYGSCISDELFREFLEISQLLGAGLIRRIRKTPF